MKALEAGNEGDARKFLERKASLESKLSELQMTFQSASSNASQMRKMHDKLVSDIGELEARKNMMKAKWSVAKTQERMNKLGTSVSGANQSVSALNRAHDQANAMAELNSATSDGIEDLTAKYDTGSTSDVDDELAALKAKMMLNQSYIRSLSFADR